MPLFTSKPIIVRSQGFNSAEEVPGLDDLARDGHFDVIDMIKKNLMNPSLCLQLVDTKQASKVAFVEENSIKRMIAVRGWKIIQQLGQGKDGTTYFASRYGDENATHILKLLTQYGKTYHNHSQIFDAMIKRIKYTPLHSALIKQEFDTNNHFTHYGCSKPFKHIKQVPFKVHKALSTICKMNSWCIKNTGFVFWDLGYGNGRNFMMDSEGTIKWVDYGGAGMLQCTNFEDVYKTFDYLPDCTIQPMNGKKSLVKGTSDFVMAQFLLNYEFWSQPTTTADLYSSMLQVKSEVIPEITKWVLPNILSTKVTRELYANFKDSNWLQDTTWENVGKYFDANT